MPILKFWKKNSGIVLDKLRMEDITEDNRTTFIDKASFMNDKYKISEGVFIAINDLFFKMARIFNTDKKPINAMLIRVGNDSIIIVPSRSYVFWDGKSIEPEKYMVSGNEDNIRQQLTVSA